MEANPERYLHSTLIAIIVTEAEMLQKTMCIICIMNARLNLAWKHEIGELDNTTEKDLPKHMCR